MKHYVEITLLPDIEADISLNFLLQKVYQALHVRFVEMKNDDGLQPIGVSFPRYKYDEDDAKANTIGDKIRLFAPNFETLERFNAKQTLRKLSDYVHVTSVRDVPPNMKYGCFQRLQPKTSQLRLARRKAKRENVDIEIALSKLKNFEQLKAVEPPFIWIKSESNGEKFKLFVVYNERANDNSAAEFGTYGLSSKSTVPIF